jgi:hypothetical protein
MNKQYDFNIMLNAAVLFWHWFICLFHNYEIIEVIHIELSCHGLLMYNFWTLTLLMYNFWTLVFRGAGDFWMGKMPYCLQVNVLDITLLLSLRWLTAHAQYLKSFGKALFYEWVKWLYVMKYSMYHIINFIRQIIMQQQSASRWEDLWSKQVPLALWM